MSERIEIATVDAEYLAFAVLVREYWAWLEDRSGLPAVPAAPRDPPKLMAHLKFMELLLVDGQPP